MWSRLNSCWCGDCADHAWQVLPLAVTSVRPTYSCPAGDRVQSLTPARTPHTITLCRVVRVEHFTARVRVLYRVHYQVLLYTRLTPEVAISYRAFQNKGTAGSIQLRSTTTVWIEMCRNYARNAFTKSYSQARLQGLSPLESKWRINTLIGVQIIIAYVYIFKMLDYSRWRIKLEILWVRTARALGPVLSVYARWWARTQLKWVPGNSKTLWEWRATIRGAAPGSGNNLARHSTTNNNMQLMKTIFERCTWRRRGFPSATIRTILATLRIAATREWVLS